MGGDELWRALAPFFHSQCASLRSQSEGGGGFAKGGAQRKQVPWKQLAESRREMLWSRKLGLEMRLEGLRVSIPPCAWRRELTPDSHSPLPPARMLCGPCGTRGGGVS